MSDLRTNVTALLRLISHYRLTGDIKKNNVMLLKIIDSQIGTDHSGQPLMRDDGRPKECVETSVAVPTAKPGGSNLEIFTDGACIRNPGGDGGWGFVAVRASSRS